jgi:HPt (histidine-containing phosphotransfer) domain-containing protein
MQIDESDEQQQNAYSSIDKSLESDSNVTVERDLHSKKDHLPSVSTDEGMQIDESDEQRLNAYSSMDESLERDSNVTVERDLHP